MLSIIPFGVHGLEDLELQFMAKELQLLEPLLEGLAWGSWAKFFIEYAAVLGFMSCALQSLQSSLSVVNSSMRTYTQLAFWMPTAELQLKFIEKKDIRPLMGLQDNAIKWLSMTVIVACACKVSLVASAFCYYLAIRAKQTYAEEQVKADMICCFNMHEFAHRLMAEKAEKKA